MSLRLKAGEVGLSTSGSTEDRAFAREAGDFVQSFARGLAVIEAFDRDHPAMTLSEVARHAGLTRAAARRLLLTLCQLGYAESDGRRFALRPRVLKLGFAFLHAQGIWDLAQPFLVELVERIHESCSIAVLDGADIVYVARVPTRTRIMSINLGLGSRLPAHATSLGRVLLAALPDAELERRLASGAPFTAHTEHTVTDPAELRRRILAVRERGWCLLDQELELGLRSLAVPLHGAGGRVVAALNTGLQASRFTTEAMRKRILPELQSAAQRISQALGGA